MSIPLKIVQSLVVILRLYNFYLKNYKICRSKVVVEGRPSTTPSKPCVRLSPHMAFQSSVAINALGDNNHFEGFRLNNDTGFRLVSDF